ncbi:MAG: GNAT family N-acetyltransferase [Candidatus Heimdallarchaeota archaeon]|nr:GNAT family N-acetyltransferase [Candidatus Heimdallarchaeota archaeon]
MSVKIRSFHWENDFELVRNFLIKSYNITKSLHNWIPQRFENRKFGPCGTEYLDEEDELVKIWELGTDENTTGNNIVAITIYEPPSTFWIQIHPDYRYLELKILDWIEEQRKQMKKNNSEKQELHFYVLNSDEFRVKLLKERGYQNKGSEECIRIRSLEMSIPEYQLPDGYSIRHVNIEEDFDKYREVIGAVFPHCNKMTRSLAEKYSKASFYKANLDLVVVAPKGDFAAFCTMRFDSKSKIAELEPMGTHLEHRRKGLGKALIYEALKRVKKYQPSLICVSSAASTKAADALYNSLGFEKIDDITLWVKEL